MWLGFWAAALLPLGGRAGGVERDVLSEGMKISLARWFLAVAAILAIAPWASAHPGHEGDHGGVTWDFSGGFAHPLSGWDHLLAMIAVGLWAAQLGGRARWLVPSAFVAAMAAGAALGRAGFHLPGSDQAIAASVLVLGLLLARAVRLPVTAGIALVGAFAIFHGWAHGAEMPATARGLGYGAGFVLATAGLHAVGVGLGSLAARRSEKVSRYAGWAVTAAGVALFAA